MQILIILSVFALYQTDLTVPRVFTTRYIWKIFILSVSLVLTRLIENLLPKVVGYFMFFGRGRFHHSIN